MGPEGIVPAGIATASVIRRPVATRSSVPSRELIGVRDVLRLSAFAAGFERQGRRSPDAYFTGVRGQAARRAIWLFQFHGNSSPSRLI